MYSENEQQNEVGDVVQQLFTLTPAVAANQGATPKAKSSAKAAGAATPGMDLESAAAVQHFFTIAPLIEFFLLLKFLCALLPSARV